jgi:2',3'-cyclic-nucleotide 2'-phosphodiesterase/3'-nucleotidase
MTGNTDDDFAGLTRRRALAAVGTIGAAAAGAGLGTSAFFSDQETFANNGLVAGELDVTAAYSAHYSDWSDDESEGVEEVVMFDGAPGTVGTAADLPAGLTGLPADDAWLVAVSDPERFLENTRTGADGTAACPDGTDAETLEQPVIDIGDLKPGDFGEVTLDFAVCDNPAFVTLVGEIVAAAENGTTEPEAEDDDEREPGVELLDAVQAAVWVDDGGDGPGGNADGNNYQNGGESPAAVGSLREVLGVSRTGGGVALDGDIDPTDGGGSGDLNCFSGGTTHSVVFAWYLPVDHANEIQTDSLSFSVGLQARQCRHNDGSRLTVLHDTHVGGRLGAADAANDENIENYFGLMNRLAEPGRTLRLGVGDDIGSSALSTAFRGSHVIDPFEAGDLSHNTFGNHEFDFGPAVLRERVAETEGFQWVSANADEPTGEVFAAAQGAERFDIVEIAGVSVGVTGIITPRAREVTSLGDAVVRDPTEALNEVVPEMREAGADVVIVLSHVSNNRVRGVENFEGEGIAANVDGVDLILGDDSAEDPTGFESFGEIDGTVFSFVGDEFDFLGEVSLDVDGGAVQGASRTLYDLSEDVNRLGVEPSAPVRAAADFYRTQLDSEVIGETTVELNCVSADLRTRETNMGNFVADAIREDVDSDVVIQNGGGIRTNTLYSRGDITDLLIMQILPFGNVTVELEVTGQTIHDALENGVSEFESLEGRFPQVSGLSFAWDPDAPAGDRIDPADVTVGGEPLELGTTYTLGTNNFMADGGDGYGMFVGAPRTGDGGTDLADLVIDRIQRLSPISPTVEGRITRLDGTSSTAAMATLPER